MAVAKTSHFGGAADTSSVEPTRASLDTVCSPISRARGSHFVFEKSRQHPARALHYALLVHPSRTSPAVVAPVVAGDTRVTKPCRQVTIRRTTSPRGPRSSLPKRRGEE